MSYNFRTTYRQDKDTYIEDRGYAHAMKRGDSDFATLDAEFGTLLQIGQTAQRQMDGEGWDVLGTFPLLENMKATKLGELHKAWLKAEANGVVPSSVGFAIDATERANRDINGLIAGLDASGKDKVTFCAADNSFHEVSLSQLKTMLLEIIEYGQKLYARKWELRTAIVNAVTVDAVQAVQISFAGV